jgi:phenylalanyl-tRNA synthetase beta chain
VLVNGAALGWLGVIDVGTQKQFELDVPVAAAEIELAPLIALYPPRAKVDALPAFPGIERDLSLVVAETVAWAGLREMVRDLRPEKLADIRFVGTYRGKQIGAGKKSVTFRLTFRDPSRTLRHEEVDPQVAQVVARPTSRFGAELRT